MKKIIICILVILLIVGSVFMLIKDKKDIKVGDEYYSPLIASISTRDNILLVEAGNYRYGDINQDGLINHDDYLAIELMIKNELKHTESQERLGDLNDDKKIDNDDKEILVKYLNNNDEYKYDYNKNILYCLTTTEDTSNCIFQEDKYIDNIDYSINTYYISVKNSKTGTIGTYKYSYNNY